MNKSDYDFEDYIDCRFAAGTLRSYEYQAGFRNGAAHVLERGHTQTCPYTPGTAAADAWFAGNNEGRMRAYMDFVESA